MIDQIDCETYDFGLRIKALRQKLNWTQEELGRRIGVKKETISNYENNIKSPSLERLKRLAKALHISVDYLLGIDKVPTIKLYDMTPEEESVLYEFIKTFIDRKSS